MYRLHAYFEDKESCSCGCGGDHDHIELDDDDFESAQVTLVDPETNEEFVFNIYDEFELDGEIYLVMLTDESSLKEDEEPEAIFMRVVTGEDDSEDLVSLDEEEFEKARAEYERLLEEAGELEDDEE